MSKLSISRARRRSAAELRALAPLRREIGALDRVSRQKFVQEFSDAYRTYQRVVPREALLPFCAEADVLLVSDFHALSSCQTFLVNLLHELRERDAQRPMALLLETVFTRDQHILDEWQAGSISDRELRARLRFDIDWGYDWETFARTLHAARSLGIRLHGVDCWPRGSMRRIAQRDRHAADTIARVHRQNRNALVVVLFGESHLAPGHLPRHLRDAVPDANLRVVLQNVDALYFRAAGELVDRVEALQVDSQTFAVFNATPVEKWHSYRMWIARWRSQRTKGLDVTPAVYDLIDALLSFLCIDRYADEENGSRYFVDSYPEVTHVSSLRRARALLERRHIPDARRDDLLTRLAERGAAYIPEKNLLVITELRLQSAAQEIAAFVHHACRDFTEAQAPWGDQDPESAFYLCVMEDAIAEFGARVLFPSHPGSEEDDIFSLYEEAPEEVEASTTLSYGEYMRLIDCVMMHRDYELHSRSYAGRPWMLDEFLAGPVGQLELLARHLGALLASDLYRAYLSGRFTRREARSLFFRRLSGAAASETYFSLARRLRTRRERLAA